MLMHRIVGTTTHEQGCPEYVYLVLDDVPAFPRQAQVERLWSQG